MGSLCHLATHRNSTWIEGGQHFLPDQLKNLLIQKNA